MGAKWTVEIGIFPVLTGKHERMYPVLDWAGLSDLFPSELHVFSANN